MYKRPEIGFIHLYQITCNSKNYTPIPAIPPKSRSKLWADIKAGKTPITTLQIADIPLHRVSWN
jgi:hypothetical protein